MVDLSVVKNAKLRALIESSKKFSSLSTEKQEAHLEHIVSLPDGQQEEVCQFFEKENAKEETDTMSQDEKIRVLMKLYDDVVALEKKFTSLLRKEPELKERKVETKKMQTLLNKLNNS